MQWIKASERLPEKDAKYYCRSNGGVKMYIWNKDIYTSLEWLDESPQPSKDERIYIIHLSDKVNSILVAALRELDDEQMICLRDALIERTPKQTPSKDVPVQYAEGEDDIAFDFHRANEKAPSKDVEAAAKEYARNIWNDGVDEQLDVINYFIAGAKWAEQAKEGDKPVG